MMEAAALYTQIREQMDRDICKLFSVSTEQIAVDHPPMTAATILAAMNSVRAMAPARPALRFVFTATALKSTSDRTFPASRHRSARTHKKLVKRYGGEFRLTPTMWRVGDVVYAHPLFRRQLELSIPAVASASPSAPNAAG